MTGKCADHRQADPGLLSAGWELRGHPDTVVANDHRQEPVAGPDLHLHRSLLTRVGVQHHVVAGLRGGGADVAEVGRVEAGGRGYPG